jgi:hypothetical protein
VARQADVRGPVAFEQAHVVEKGEAIDDIADVRGVDTGQGEELAPEARLTPEASGRPT